MATCFLFIEPIDLAEVDQFWFVRLDDAGEVDLPLALYTSEDIKNMQVGHETVVVLPASVVSLHRLELPKLSARKAREAIPYALEEELAEPVAELHIAFDRDAQNDRVYRIVVINRLRLRACMNELRALAIAFDAITIDWFALRPGEVCATVSDVLVDQGSLMGALSPLLATQYLKVHPDITAGFTFDDSVMALEDFDPVVHEGSYRLFVAKRLQKGGYINLCQGDFQHQTHDQGRALWYGVSAVLFGVWFVSVLGMNALTLYRLHIKQDRLDAQIAKHYRIFFPEAAQVISPRFRIERLLSQTKAAPQDVFWMLFDKLAHVVASSPLEIEQIRFRDQTLWVSVVAQDFALLEVFEQKLKKAHVSVRQTQARTQNNQVTATLELHV